MSRDRCDEHRPQLEEDVKSGLTSKAVLKILHTYARARGFYANASFVTKWTFNPSWLRLWGLKSNTVEIDALDLTKLIVKS
jgi:hypothetical protein